MHQSKTQIATALIFHRLTNYFLLGAILLSALAYMYFVNSAVRSVGLLQNFKSEYESLSARVSDLESDSLALENEVSLAKALSLGLTEVQRPIFIVKGGAKQALSFNVR